MPSINTEELERHLHIEDYRTDLYIKVDKKNNITKYKNLKDLLLSTSDAKLMFRRVMKSENGPRTTFNNYFFTYVYFPLNNKGQEKKSFRLNGVKFSDLKSEEDTRGSYVARPPYLYYTIYDLNNQKREFALGKVDTGTVIHYTSGKFSDLFFNEINELSKAIKDLKYWKLVDKYFYPFLENQIELVRLRRWKEIDDEYDERSKKEKEILNTFFDAHDLEEKFEKFKEKMLKKEEDKSDE